MATKAILAARQGPVGTVVEIGDAPVRTRLPAHTPGLEVAGLVRPILGVDLDIAVAVHARPGLVRQEVPDIARPQDVDADTGLGPQAIPATVGGLQATRRPTTGPAPTQGAEAVGPAVAPGAARIQGLHSGAQGAVPSRIPKHCNILFSGLDLTVNRLVETRKRHATFCLCVGNVSVERRLEQLLYHPPEKESELHLERPDVRVEHPVRH